MKHFLISSRFYKEPPKKFAEDNAPKWLTGEGTTKGSTMDNRWFWEDHVLKLEVGTSIETDFHIITRIE